MKHIDIILSFDYELPLGGILKSFEHSLFSPTEKLLNVVDKLNVPIVLFADILSYIKFKDYNISDYFIPFEEQLIKFIKKGQDVQLHIHPHWLETTIKGKLFKPSKKFTLSDFSNGNYPENIAGIIETGFKSLTDICIKGDDNYKCIAYRAGGYDLFPNTADILKALYDCGIRIDSSISRGYYFKSDTSYVNYRKVPKLPNWYLSLKGDLRIASNDKNGLFEIPIASKPKGLFEVPTKFKLKKYGYRAVENRGNMIHTNDNIKISDKLKQLLSSRMLTVDNHTYDIDNLIKIIDFNIKKFDKSDRIILSLIGHPKSMDEYHFQLLKKFVITSQEKYGSKIRFVTYRQIFDEMTMKN